MEVSKLDASLVVWLVLFLLGGGLLALYYAGIGYFPEVTWQDALNYIALMTMIGGGLLVAYAFLLFVPGAIWARYLIFDETFRSEKVFLMASRDDETPCVFAILRRLVFPFALFIVFCHCLLYLAVDGSSLKTMVWVASGAAASLAAISGLLGKIILEALRYPPPAQREKPWHLKKAFPQYGLLVVASHVPLFIALAYKARTSCPPSQALLWSAALLPLASFFGLLLPGTSKKLDDKWSHLCRAFLAFDSAALLSLAALWFFYLIYHEVRGSLLVTCTLVVIVANLIVSVLFEEDRYPALLASFLATLLLLGAGQVLPPANQTLPARIMAKYGFGEQNVRLVLTRKGGRILLKQGIPVYGGEQEKVKPPSRLRTVKATVLSHLGSEYLLRVEVGDQWKKVTVPKTEVVSWSVSEKLEPEKSPKICPTP